MGENFFSILFPRMSMNHVFDLGPFSYFSDETREKMK